jgi:small-conductance mechanosensitive channel
VLQGSVEVMTRGQRRDWTIGAVAGALAFAALVSGSEFGNVHASHLHPEVIGWASAGVLLVCGLIAVARTSTALGRLVAGRSLPTAGSAVRVISAGTGYLVVVFSTLGLLAVGVEHLLVGAGLAGVMLGIAAQQSLGNVCAGLVLILARPFGVGDHIRVRSGPLGGIFDAWVREISLTYVTLQTADGELKIPNSAMLGAGIGKLAPLPAGTRTDAAKIDLVSPPGPQSRS